MHIRVLVHILIALLVDLLLFKVGQSSDIQVVVDQIMFYLPDLVRCKGLVAVSLKNVLASPCAVFGC